MKHENFRMKDLNFVDNNLYALKEETGISIVEDGLWKIKFPEGDLSDYGYNISRAKENAKRYWLNHPPQAPCEPAGEFK